MRTTDAVSCLHVGWQNTIDVTSYIFKLNGSRHYDELSFRLGNWFPLAIEYILWV